MLSLKSLFQRQPEPLIGLDISATAVKLVELARHGQDGWTLERCTMVPLPPGCIVDGSIANMDEVSATIHRLLAKSGTRTKNVALALPASAVITKKVILPGALSDQEMEIQVESEASQYLPFALEEVRLDFCVIGPNAKNPGDVDVLLAATRKEKAHERQEAAEIAGLKPTVLDIESYAALLAVQRVLDHPQAPTHVGEADLAVLINVGDRGYTMQVLRGEEILFDHEQGMGGAQLTQAIARYYSIPPEEAEQKKRNDNLPDDYATAVLAPFVKNLALDIGRSLQFFFTSTPYHSVQHILLFGGSAILEGLASAIQNETKVSTLVLDPFLGMELGSSINKSKIRKAAPAYLTACGLALRRFYQ